jgi:dehydrogenase/reductase SDR family member 12
MTTAGSRVAAALDAALEASVIGSFSRVGFTLRARMFAFTDPLIDHQPHGRVLVTGANSGLGFAVTLALLASGTQVLATTRAPDKSATMRTQLDLLLGFPAGDQLVTDEVDLHRFADVNAFAARHTNDTLDALIHNAGALQHQHHLTPDGFEQTIQTHVLSPFMLTTLLRESLERSGRGQVITVTSGGLYSARLGDSLCERPKDGFNGTRTYAEAKRAQLVLSGEWQRRFGSSRLAFYATHPGWVDTPGLRQSLPGFASRLRPLLRDTRMGVDTIVYLYGQQPDPVANRVWHDRRPRRAHRLPTTFARRGSAGQLWADVCRATGVNPYA